MNAMNVQMEDQIPDVPELDLPEIESFFGEMPKVAEADVTTPEEYFSGVESGASELDEEYEEGVDEEQC